MASRGSTAACLGTVGAAGARKYRKLSHCSVQAHGSGIVLADAIPVYSMVHCDALCCLVRTEVSPHGRRSKDHVAIWPSIRYDASVPQKSFKQFIAENISVIGLTLLSLVIVTFLAYRSASARPPTIGEATALAVLAGIFQVLASIMGVSKGRADPNFVKGAIMRLGKILLKAQAAAEISEKAFDHETTHSRRIALGQLSVILSFLQDETADAIRDWNNLYPDLIVELAKEGGQDLKKIASNAKGAQNG